MLLVTVNCLTDKAKDLGIDWWVNSPMFRKDKSKEVPESTSHSNFAREAAPNKRRNLHLATRRPA